MAPVKPSKLDKLILASCLNQLGAYSRKDKAEVRKLSKDSHAMQRYVGELEESEATRRSMSALLKGKKKLGLVITREAMMGGGEDDGDDVNVGINTGVEEEVVETHTATHTRATPTTHTRAHNVSTHTHSHTAAATQARAHAYTHSGVSSCVEDTLNGVHTPVDVDRRIEGHGVDVGEGAIMEGVVVGVCGSGGKSEGVGGMNVWVDGVPPTCKRGDIVLVKLGAAEDGQAQEAYAEVLELGEGVIHVAWLDPCASLSKSARASETEAPLVEVQTGADVTGSAYILTSSVQNTEEALEPANLLINLTQHPEYARVKLILDRRYMYNFGVMPSQPGEFKRQELIELADYLVWNTPEELKRVLWKDGKHGGLWSRTQAVCTHILGTASIDAHHAKLNGVLSELPILTTEGVGWDGACVWCDRFKALSHFCGSVGMCASCHGAYGVVATLKRAVVKLRERALELTEYDESAFVAHVVEAERWIAENGDGGSGAREGVGESKGGEREVVVTRGRKRRRSGRGVAVGAGGSVPVVGVAASSSSSHASMEGSTHAHTHSDTPADVRFESGGGLLVPVSDRASNTDVFEFEVSDMEDEEWRSVAIDFNL